MDDWDGDPIQLCEDMAKEAVKLAAILAVLVGSALFCLGFLTGRFL